MNRVIPLIIRILRNGKIRHSGYDFSTQRALDLEHLKAYLPAVPKRKTRLARLMKNKYIRMWLGEAAHLKRSFATEGGHLHLREPAICYVRIPRAASTALSRTILSNKIPELKDQSLTARQINSLTDLYMERNVSEVDHAPVFFTVVRNPFARLVSVYRQFFERDTHPFIYEDYLFGILRREYSFAEFVKVVNEIPDRLKDQHLKPQHLFLRYYEKMNVRVKVMKLETPETIQTFLRIHGLQFDVFNQTQTPYDYRNYYDATTLQAVSALYREDILRFGYEKTAEDIQFTIEHRPVQM